METQERIIHCHACSRYVQMADDNNEGDVITCPFCGTKNRIGTMTVYIGQPVEEA